MSGITEHEVEESDCSSVTTENDKIDLK